MADEHREENYTSSGEEPTSSADWADLGLCTALVEVGIFPERETALSRSPRSQAVERVQWKAPTEIQRRCEVKNGSDKPPPCAILTVVSWCCQGASCGLHWPRCDRSGRNRIRENGRLRIADTTGKDSGFPRRTALPHVALAPYKLVHCASRLCYRIRSACSR